MLVPEVRQDSGIREMDSISVDSCKGGASGWEGGRRSICSASDIVAIEYSFVPSTYASKRRYQWLYLKLDLNIYLKFVSAEHALSFVNFAVARWTKPDAVLVVPNSFDLVIGK